MSDINLEFTVSNNNIDFTVNSNEITITPTDIQLEISQSGIRTPGLPLNSVQYNKDNEFAGSSVFSYIEATETLGVPNVVINGSATIANANITNITSLTSNVENVHILGGTNGYVLQTDGTGNLNWTVQTGGGGNGSPGGANTQVQFNDSGLFGGNASFTFNKTTGVLSAPSLVSNLVTGNLVTASQSNITAVGNLSSLTVVGMTSIQEAKEKVTIDAVAATGTINFDILTQAILYKTSNTTSNFTLNVRGNSSTTLDSVMSTGQSLTCTLLNTVASVGGYANNFTIDGSTVTVKYPGGAPTTGILNSINSYTFNIIKLGANTYTVLGSLIGYK